MGELGNSLRAINVSWISIVSDFWSSTIIPKEVWGGGIGLGECLV
jgi:hypothetical protein